MPKLRTPGVYITEIDAFPNRVEPVETAIPAFIGYTEKADIRGKSVLHRPIRIRSFVEFEEIYGALPVAKFSWTNANDPDALVITLAAKDYYLKQTSSAYMLYKSIKLFYQNGGSNCYIVAVGDYNEDIKRDALLTGIESIAREPEPSMLVIPDSTSLNQSECADVQNAMIEHCGDSLKNRVAILDVYELDAVNNSAQLFRQTIGNVNGVGYAAAYMPYLNSVVVSNSDVSLTNFSEDSRKQLSDILISSNEPANAELKGIIASIAEPHRSKYKDPDIHRVLNASSSAYRYILSALQEVMNIVPPSGAVTGAVVQTDTNRGVWKAPANVSLIGVVSPTLAISDQQQQTLNVDVNGKSINAIRAFIGEGTLIWGARTLDGNNNETRYINVRRTLIMIEQSIMLAIKAYVFEPNDANTWSAIRTMVKNFLNELWRQGALAGSTPDQAFAVQLGINETMTQQDIIDGTLRLSVLIAIARPAEFIQISITQQMQTA